MNITDKQIFDKFRQMAGGRLTQEQVDGLNAVIAASSRADIAAMFALTDDVYMKVSLEGMAIIAGFEGFRDKAYQDGAGVWTIGFGTTRYFGKELVKKGDTCTREQALLWKQYDIAEFEEHVNQIITVPMKQNQFDALVSFVYNIGVTAFHGGSVDDHINSGNIEEAVKVWAKYNKIRNPKSKQLEVSNGLNNRRKAEIALFLS